MLLHKVCVAIDASWRHPPKQPGKPLMLEYINFTCACSNTCMDEAAETTRDSCGAKLHPKTSKTKKARIICDHMRPYTCCALATRRRCRAMRAPTNGSESRFRGEATNIRAPTKQGCRKQLLPADADVKNNPRFSWDLNERPLQQAFARIAAQGGSQCNRTKTCHAEGHLLHSTSDVCAHNIMEPTKKAPYLL